MNEAGAEKMLCTYNQRKDYLKHCFFCNLMPIYKGETIANLRLLDAALRRIRDLSTEERRLGETIHKNPGLSLSEIVEHTDLLTEKVVEMMKKRNWFKTRNIVPGRTKRYDPQDHYDLGQLVLTPFDLNPGLVVNSRDRRIMVYLGHSQLKEFSQMRAPIQGYQGIRS